MRVFIWRTNLLRIVTVCILLIITVLGMRSGFKPLVDTVMTVATSNRLLPIYRVETEARRLSISFDATWGTDLTDEILTILREHDLKTTFFLAGYWVDKYPQYVIRIAEEGHEIGNHSYSHPHMNSLSFDGIVRELEKNHAMIADLTGQDPFLFRPPFGEYNNTVIQAAESINYYTIQWSIDSLDWKNTSSNEVYQRVKEKAGPGDIVLFHNAARPTPDALRRLIPELLADDYEIVPISALIYRQDYVMLPDGTQSLRGPRP